MNSPNPKVSVGVPVYNGEKYLDQALNSLIHQDYEDFEIVISDNASTDATAELCRAYAARDKRVRYFRNETNIGSAQNYKRVFELARGAYFKWCAHDDVCYPGFLSRCVEVMDAAPPSVALVYPQCDLIGEFGEVLERAPDRMETKARQPHRRLAHSLWNVICAYPLWGLVRANVLRRTRLVGRVPYWDNLLLTELSLFGEFWEIAAVLFQVRCHRGNSYGVSSSHQASTAWNDPDKADQKTKKAVLVWTDPSNAKKNICLPAKEEIYWEYLKRIYHAPLPPSEKLLCYATVPCVCYWRRLHNFGGFWKRRLIRTLLDRGESISGVSSSV